MPTKTESEWQPDYRLVKIIAPFACKDRFYAGLHYIRCTVKDRVATYDATDGYTLLRIAAPTVGDDFVGYIDVGDVKWFVGGMGRAPAEWFTDIAFPDLARAIPTGDITSERSALSAVFMERVGKAFRLLSALGIDKKAGKRAMTIVETNAPLEPSRMTMSVNTEDGRIEALAVIMPIRID